MWICFISFIPSGLQFEHYIFTLYFINLLKFCSESYSLLNSLVYSLISVVLFLLKFSFLLFNMNLRIWCNFYYFFMFPSTVYYLQYLYHLFTFLFFFRSFFLFLLLKTFILPYSVLGSFSLNSCYCVYL